MQSNERNYARRGKTSSLKFAQAFSYPCCYLANLAVKLRPSNKFTVSGCSIFPVSKLSRALM